MKILLFAFLIPLFYFIFVLTQWQACLCRARRSYRVLRARFLVELDGVSLEYSVIPMPVAVESAGLIYPIEGGSFALLCFALQL